MTDKEIIKRLARLQARGELGAAQARVFVTGGWLPFPEWDLIYVALLKLAQGRFHRAVVRHPREQDCQLLLEALRAGEGEAEEE